MAYYDAPSDAIVLVDVDRPQAKLEQTVFHELVHVLQDQRFGAASQRERLTGIHCDRRDEALAYVCLVEGEAVVLTLSRAGRPADVPRLLAERRQALADQPATEQALNAPYAWGATAVWHTFTRGGWKAVDSLFRERVLSSEHILHPEKAWGPGRDDPVELQLPNLSSLMGKGWRLRGQDTLGEYFLRLLFQTWSGDPQEKACAGWDGDRLQVLWTSL